MLAGSLCFAAMNALARGLRHIPWPALGFSRALIGFVAAVLVARARGASLSIVDRRRMWERSIAGSTGMLCTFYALTHMPLADATALLNTTPLWIAALAWVTLRERLSTRVWVALAIAFAGVLLIERPGLRVDGFAGVVALGAGLAGALAMVSLRKLSGETPDAVVVHFSAIATGILGLALARHVIFVGVPSMPSPRDAGLVLLMGLAATGGQFSITRAYALDKAARVGASGWIQLALALAIDALVFHRWPDHPALAGITLLLVSGALLVDDARREA